MSDDDEFFEPSKSQLKRDAKALVAMGEKLLTVPEEQIVALDEAKLLVAIQDAKKITKGNAKKRQLQYIGKLLRQIDTAPVQDILDRFDASSIAHNAHFHQLEQWRERLIEGDSGAFDEITSTLPDIDRQQLRSLIRNAVTERQQGKEPPVHFRKLFQFLKAASEP